jgi:hypothetical protein
MIRTISPAARPAAIGMLVLALAACGHAPSSKKAAAAPRAVAVLIEAGPDGTATQAFPQYWKRNTLVIDLQGAAAAGELTLKPRPGKRWPARLAFRVMPGSVRMMEVRADQRMIIPVTREGTAPVDIELLPGVYSRKSPQLTLQWGM